VRVMVQGAGTIGAAQEKLSREMLDVARKDNARSFKGAARE